MKNSFGVNCPDLSHLPVDCHLCVNHKLGTAISEASLQNIVIVRSLPGLGDLLCIVPALRALRTALPTAKLTLIGLKEARNFVQRFRCYLDKWLEFPGFPGIPEVNCTASQSVSFLSQMQAQNFDLALQMHGNGLYMNSFVLLLNAKLNAGFFLENHYCPDRDRFLPFIEQQSEVRRHLQLLEFLGIPSQGEHLEFPVWQSDWQEFEQVIQQHNLQLDGYVCLHPGASEPARRWSPQQFAAIADNLAGQGLQIVLTGTAAELPLTQAVVRSMQFPAINLAGQTSLGGLAALLTRSRLLICNDTGVSHLAAATQTRSVVIFLTSDPQRWAPLNQKLHRVVQGNLPIASTAVLTAAADLLQQPSEQQSIELASSALSVNYQEATY